MPRAEAAHRTMASHDLVRMLALVSLNMDVRKLTPLNCCKRDDVAGRA